MTLQYYRKFLPNEQKDKKDELEFVEVVIRCTKIPIDILIFVMYTRLMIYFVKIKHARLKEDLIRFTCMNKTVVVIAIFLGFLAFYSTGSQLAYLILIYFFDN